MNKLLDKQRADNISNKLETYISNSELVELKSILHLELPELKVQKSEKSLAYALALAYIDQILYDREEGEKR
jgi:hypothetical protein